MNVSSTVCTYVLASCRKHLFIAWGAHSTGFIALDRFLLYGAQQLLLLCFKTPNNRVPVHSLIYFLSKKINHTITTINLFHLRLAARCDFGSSGAISAPPCWDLWLWIYIEKVWKSACSKAAAASRQPSLSFLPFAHCLLHAHEHNNRNAYVPDLVFPFLFLSVAVCGHLMQAASRTDVNSNTEQAASFVKYRRGRWGLSGVMFNLRKTKSVISLSALVECRSRICRQQAGPTMQMTKGCYANGKNNQVSVEAFRQISQFLWQKHQNLQWAT